MDKGIVESKVKPESTQQLEKGIVENKVKPESTQQLDFVKNRVAQLLQQEITATQPNAEAVRSLLGCVKTIADITKQNFAKCLSEILLIKNNWVLQLKLENRFAQLEQIMRRLLGIVETRPSNKKNQRVNPADDDAYFKLLQKQWEHVRELGILQDELKRFSEQQQRMLENALWDLGVKYIKTQTTLIHTTISQFQSTIQELLSSPDVAEFFTEADMEFFSELLRETEQDSNEVRFEEQKTHLNHDGTRNHQSKQESEKKIDMLCQRQQDRNRCACERLEATKNKPGMSQAGRERISQGQVALENDNRIFTERYAANSGKYHDNLEEHHANIKAIKQQSAVVNASEKSQILNKIAEELSSLQQTRELTQEEQQTIDIIHKKLNSPDINDSLSQLISLMSGNQDEKILQLSDVLKEKQHNSVPSSANLSSLPHSVSVLNSGTEKSNLLSNQSLVKNGNNEFKNALASVREKAIQEEEAKNPKFKEINLITSNWNELKQDNLKDNKENIKKIDAGLKQLAQDIRQGSVPDELVADKLYQYLDFLREKNKGSSKLGDLHEKIETLVCTLQEELNNSLNEEHVNSPKM